MGRINSPGRYPNKLYTESYKPVFRLNILLNRAFNCGLTVQPYVAIVGNLEEINTSLSYYTVIKRTPHTYLLSPSNKCLT